MPVSKCPILAADEKHERDYSEASEAMRLALKGNSRTPSELKWRGTYQKPAAEGSYTIWLAKVRTEEHRKEWDRVEGLRANRDPCVRCGTRHDRHHEFGCSQFRRAE